MNRIAYEDTKENELITTIDAFFRNCELSKLLRLSLIHIYGLAVVTVGSFAAEQKFMTCGMVGSLERNIQRRRRPLSVCFFEGVSHVVLRG